MKALSTLVPILLAAVGCGRASTSSGLLAAGEVPPQFVLLAFDGSKSSEMWQETRDFAAQSTTDGKPIKFTYFINSTYFLKQAARNNYFSPQTGTTGQSAIGFGGTAADVEERVAQMNDTYAAGHEMGSHASGHYDGSGWSLTQWKREFQEFRKIMEHVPEYNGIAATTVPAFSVDELIGFRAPQLGTNASMFQVLVDNHFQYDTSLTSTPNYWPHRKNGVWNFPLASIKMWGSSASTLSMDYNWYVKHGETANVAQQRQYEEQMYQSYMSYFTKNYYRNRAPVHIGHHFSKWNGGAYWRAMQRFAASVCGLPNVKCATYSELLAFAEENAERVDDFAGANYASQVDDLPELAAWRGGLGLVDDDADAEAKIYSPEEMRELGLTPDCSTAHDD